jgi:glycosyltransferase involved in cell wall biosynthesis
VVVSETLQRHYESQHGRRPDVIPNAVIPCKPVEPDRIKRFGIEKRRFILFAGRISPEKGVHTLLEAMSPLRDRMPVVIAGGSSYSEDYIQRVRAMAWDDVRFIGNVPHEDMEELLSNCYAYVLPSVMEGLSISLLEAVSYGACIITTAIPENLEVVGDCALTVPVGDAAALNEAFRTILDDPARAEELREKAAARAAAQPDWDEVTARTETLYRRILAER